MCDYPGCTKGYAKNFSLTRHKKTHAAIRPHRCEWCSKDFPEKSALKRHMQVHTGDKPFECPYKDNCGKKFAAATNLKKHMIRFHQGDTTY